MKLKLVLILICLAICLVSCGGNGSVETNNEATGADIKIEGADEKVENPGGAVLSINLSKPESANGIAGVAFQNGELKITKPGSYILTGKLEKGSVTVTAGGKDTVELILDSVVITNPDGPAIYVSKADKVYLTLADKTESTLSDGDSYEITRDESNLDGAVFSKADLIVRGGGKLTVNGNNKHGIVSKDELTLAGGAVSVKAKNVALNGKDAVKISDSEVELEAGSDGIRADNTEYLEQGYVYVESGKVNITASNDGIQAETTLKIAGGEITIVSGGGSGNASSNQSGGFNDKWGSWDGYHDDSETTESAKGIKAGGSVEITGGNVKLDSSDDSIHSNGEVLISSGIINASSGDDGIHADAKAEISGGELTIYKSYEGIEACEIVISGGKSIVTSSDDGLNAAGGNDASSLGGRPGQGMFEESSGNIMLSGGFMKLDATGDGIDSNGPITLSGGVFLVSGPTNGGNGAFDYAGEAKVTGGVLVATGSVGMATGFTSAENQGAMLVSTGTQTAGVALTLSDTDGNVIVSFVPDKAYQCAVITAPGIVTGKSYVLSAGGEASEADSLGFADGGTLSGGEVVSHIEMTDSIYTENGFSMIGPGGIGPGGMGPGGFDPGGMRPGKH